eukprot:6130854-Amphidinium_carterae.1
MSPPFLSKCACRHKGETFHGPGPQTRGLKGYSARFAKLPARFTQTVVHSERACVRVCVRVCLCVNGCEVCEWRLYLTLLSSRFLDGFDIN